MSKRAEKVEQVLEEVRSMHMAIDDLARPKDKALLEALELLVK